MIKAVIPFDEFYPENVLNDEMSKSLEKGSFGLFSRQRLILNRRIGTKADICLTAIKKENDESVIEASRKKAMDIIRRRTFLTENSCKDGDMCKGLITNVADHSLVIEYGGTETVMPQAKLTYRYLPTLQGRYKAGQEIKFIMRDLKIEGEKVTFNPDTKSVEKAEFAQILKDPSYLKSDTDARATIISVKENAPGAELTVRGFLTDYDVPVYIGTLSKDAIGAGLICGDEVLLKITKVLADKGYVEGNIFRILDTDAMLAGL